MASSPAIALPGQQQSARYPNRTISRVHVCNSLVIDGFLYRLVEICDRWVWERETN